jgi:hypothetical protein
VLSHYSVACLHEHCAWNGSLVPSPLQGGADAETASMQRAWFRCPRCQREWEVRSAPGSVTFLATVGRGNETAPLDEAPQAF